LKKMEKRGGRQGEKGKKGKKQKNRGKATEKSKGNLMRP